MSYFITKGNNIDEQYDWYLMESEKADIAGGKINIWHAQRWGSNNCR